MKKYKYIYIAIFSIILLMILTKGIQYGITVNEINNSDASGHSILLIYNIIIYLILSIIMLIITLNKENNTKHKYLMLIVFVLLLVIVAPIGINRVNGFDGKPVNTPISILTSFLFNG